jgi:hypothetical protein
MCGANQPMYQPAWHVSVSVANQLSSMTNAMSLVMAGSNHGYHQPAES